MFIPILKIKNKVYAININIADDLWYDELPGEFTSYHIASITKVNRPDTVSIELICFGLIISLILYTHGA
jgi:hypothetical protein